MTEFISMTDEEYWQNEDRRTALYHQALDEIEAENGGVWMPDYYQRANARHKELCDQEGVIMFVAEPVQRADLRYEDRETRIASGEQQWQGGGV